MLLEFRCANHKSIREEVVFSMLAGSDHTHSEQLLSAGKLQLLRTALIYGANGSGKSNLLDAIETLREWVLGRMPIVRTPHKLAADQPSRYVMQFLCHQVHYQFSLTLHPDNTIEESLCTYPNGRLHTVYHRIDREISMEKALRSEIGEYADALSAHILLAAHLSTTAEPILALRRFFGETLVPYHAASPGERMQRALAILRDQPKVKQAVLSLLSSLSTGICDIHINQGNGELGASVIYPGFSTNLLLEESTGIRRLIEFLCPLIDMLCDDCVLLCDEPETNLHEVLLRRLIGNMRIFSAAHSSQLIFSTHSTSLLDLSLFRRDQIWFTELRPQDRSTDLYSLLEIRDVQANENIRQGYIAGKYGAIPHLDENR
ncbi:MAG: ATP-binding protein [Clostridia bacterium]|nr:ATP-binding protein [Clostridia bacterium]